MKRNVAKTKLIPSNSPKVLIVLISTKVLVICGAKKKKNPPSQLIYLKISLFTLMNIYFLVHINKYKVTKDNKIK